MKPQEDSDQISPRVGHAWRVCHWKAIYENNRSREIKDLNWIPIPIHMDGDGYTELLDHPHGAAHYGAWIALVCIAARAKERGLLQRDAGLPHDAATLARISRIDLRYFNEAIPRFIAVGWLEVVAIKNDSRSPQEGATTPQEPAVLPHNSAPRARAEYTEYKEQKEHTEEMGNRAERSMIFDEYFQEFKTLCVQAGEHGCLIGGDSDSWNHAWYAWTVLDASQRIDAISGIRRRVEAEAWDDSILKSLPNNVLAKKTWNRPIAQGKRQLSRFEEMLKNA